MEEEQDPQLMLRVLRRHWGERASFRPLQREAVSALLAGRDVLLVMATGSGKSLAFSLPALVRHEARLLRLAAAAKQQQPLQQQPRPPGKNPPPPPPEPTGCFVAVVSPLIALAREQVSRLQDELGVEAEALLGETAEQRRRAVLSDLASGDPSTRLLFTTPEQLRKESVSEALREAEAAGSLVAFAIDEAHCAVTWGREFRPAYLELRARLREAFPRVPILAATATATEGDRRAIAVALGLRLGGSEGERGGVVLVGSANRPNIRYRVRFKELLALRGGRGQREDGGTVAARGGGSGGGYYAPSSSSESEEEENEDQEEDEEEDGSDDEQDDDDGAPPANARQQQQQQQQQQKLAADLDRRAAAAATRDLVRWVARRSLRKNQAGIVYARTRERVDALAAALAAAGVDAAPYHAGRDADARARVAARWAEGDLRVVVATVAFGMGVDRGDVSFVAHADPPSSVEGYAQEAGRAGRDGAAADSVVWASHEDFETVAGLQRRGGGRGGGVSVASVADLLGAGDAAGGGCLRRRLLAHFGERREGGCGEGERACDFCSPGVDGGGEGGGGAGWAGGASRGSGKAPPLVRGAAARRALARWREVGRERAARAARAALAGAREEEEEGGGGGGEKENVDGRGNNEEEEDGEEEEGKAAAARPSLPSWGPAAAYAGAAGLKRPRRQQPAPAHAARPLKAASPPAAAAAAAAEPPPPPLQQQQQQQPPPPPAPVAAPRPPAEAAATAIAAARPILKSAPGCRRPFVPPLRRKPPPP